MTLSRRRFLQVSGLVAASTALSSSATLEVVGEAMASSLPSVAVATAGAGLFAGPGNVDYGLLGTLAKGQRVTPLGVFGDFARVTATSIRTPAGALARGAFGGYVLKSALGPLPHGLATIHVAKTPWLTRSFVEAARPLVMPSVGILADGDKDYMLLDGTWRAVREFQLVADIGFASEPGIPTTSTSGIVIENVTWTQDAGNPGQLTVLHNGHPSDLGWYVGYHTGTMWDFVDRLPLPTSLAAGRLTIAVDGTGQFVTIGLPNGDSVGRILRLPLFRVGDVLSASLSDGPYTDMTASSVSLSLAPLGRAQPPVAPYGSLRAAAAGSGITIGVAVDSWRPTPDPRFEPTVTSQFDLIVPSGDFNWEWRIRPDATHFDFAGADLQVAFARRHGLNLRAYLLPSGSWPGGLPAWLTGGGYTRSQLLDLVHEHIDTVVGRYRGIVSEWLIASETIYQGVLAESNFWLKNVGPEFIDLAYTWARAADPAAKLLYEFSGSEWAEPQASAIYAHIADLRQRGIPVDNVGFEMHVDGANPPTKAQLLAAMRRLGTLGVGVQINEMDVNIYGVPGTQDQKYAVQAQVYRDALEALLESGVGTSFTTWGLDDPDSWLLRPQWVSAFGPAEAPLLFDGDYQPKPAYFALLDVLDKRTSIT